MQIIIEKFEQNKFRRKKLNHIEKTVRKSKKELDKQIYETRMRRLKKRKDDLRNIEKYWQAVANIFGFQKFPNEQDEENWEKFLGLDTTILWAVEEKKLDEWLEYICPTTKKK